MNEHGLKIKSLNGVMKKLKKENLLKRGASIVNAKRSRLFYQNVLKSLKHKGNVIQFPAPTEQLIIEAESNDNNRDKFKFYINRKGKYNLKKCTYMSRYKNTHDLLRIDIEGPAHDNPDGSTVECPHIHIYREGYNLAWAYPLQKIINTDSENLLQVLIDFFEYNKVTNITSYSYQEGGLV